MKKIYLLSFLVLSFLRLSAQNFCDINGNLVIYTNYDGGALHINVDANIPNLKIGVVSYEAVVVNLSGPYLSNVTGVAYAGYNGGNNHCSTGTVTAINNAPAGATKTITIAPPVTQSNPNGYGSIICGYSCSTTTSQGGCNTVDQIEAYFLNYFPGSVLYAHKAQYGCWSGTQQVSNGGSCCASISALQLTAKTKNETCNGSCDGSVTAGAAGGTPPYSFTIGGSPNLNNLCSGTYTVQVMDGAANTATKSITISSNSPPVPTGDTVQELCLHATIGDLTAAGGSINWYGAATGGTALDTNTVLADGQFYYAGTTVGPCESDRLKVLVQLYPRDVSVTANGPTLTATATGTGVSYQWLNCDGDQPILTAKQQSYTPDFSGEYAVIITEKGCTDTSECIEVIIIGIDETANEDLFSVFPNPSTGKITLSSPFPMSKATVKVFDVEGRMIREIKDISGKTHDLDLSTLEKGVYLIEMRSEKGSYTKRIVLE